MIGVQRTKFCSATESLAKLYDYHNHKRLEIFSDFLSVSDILSIFHHFIVYNIIFWLI